MKPSGFLLLILIPLTFYAKWQHSSAVIPLSVILIAAALCYIFEKPNKRNMSYIKGPVLFDEDRQLFYIHVGVKGKSMPLHYTCWGVTEEIVTERAEALVKIMSK